MYFVSLACALVKCFAKKFRVPQVKPAQNWTYQTDRGDGKESCLLNRDGGGCSFCQTLPALFFMNSPVCVGEAAVIPSDTSGGWTRCSCLGPGAVHGSVLEVDMALWLCHSTHQLTLLDSNSLR